MKSYPFSYRWEFLCTSAPADLWPLISDTNRLFKDMGQLPVQWASLSHDKKRGYKELTYEHLHRIDIWEEEPYQWEAPYRYSVHRIYRHGYYKSLTLKTDLTKRKGGTVVTIHFRGQAKGFAGWLFTKRKFSRHFRRKVGKIIASYDASVSRKNFPQVKNRRFLLKKHTRWNSLQDKLAEISGKPGLSELLIRTLKESDEADITCIHPPKLAELWGKPLHEVLEVLLYAAKIDILNFSWNITCPSCRRKLQNTRKLAEVTAVPFCQECEKDAELDFNHTIQIVFQVHPLVKKVSQKIYCAGNPQARPHVHLNHVIQPGQKKFVSISLPAGNYRIFSDKTKGIIYASVAANGLDNATLAFREDESRVQHVKLSPNPVFVLRNKTSQPLTVVCEEASWENHSIAASHVTSLQLFRNLFPRECIRPEKQIASKNLSILFTDLINSSQIYTNNGDEMAIGQVMKHFEALHQIILEERGAIVKTIGDAVMAIFPKPIYAVKAFERAHQLFKKSLKTDHPIRLKAGIHSGDCVAVTLNNRIDYFGNTVNIASRLVEHAKGGELVISSEAYKNGDLKSFITKKRDKLSIHHFDVSLKGFESHSFEAKKITLQSPLRLVV